MKKKTSEFRTCRCGKRGFPTEHEADRALGRARRKRIRMSGESLRGAHIESRTYFCEKGRMWHLTSQSRRRRINARLPEEALLTRFSEFAHEWEQWIREEVAA